MKKILYKCLSFGLLATSVFLINACGSSSTSEKGSVNTASISSSYAAPANEQLAELGKELFKSKCAACHQMDSRMVGPALRGVTGKRSFTWLMNMLEKPEEFVKNDPEAKKLFEEYNKIPMMIPGGTTEEERIAIIDYLRIEG